MIHMIKLGKTNIKITKLGFGTLPMGKLQAKMSIQEGADLIRYAINKGINFIDTACVYGSDEYIKNALISIKKKVYIATKTLAKDYITAEKDILESLKRLNVKTIDIFHLHAPRSRNPFKERKQTLKCLLDYKNKGIIKTIGLSTHSIAAVKQAADLTEIDIIHPLLNISGMGIIDGTKNEMLKAIKYACFKGKGIYIMKVLAGGNLIDKREKAFDFILNKEYPVVIGMVKKEEVDYNIKYFNNKKIPKILAEKTKKTTKKLSILEFLCKGCGKCIKFCPNKALSLVKGKIKVNSKKCVLCSYCAFICPEFVIRVV